MKTLRGIDRLTRLNEFRKELANVQLGRAAAEQVQVQGQVDAAALALAAIEGQRRGDPSQALDLSRYEFAGQLEAAAEAVLVEQRARLAQTQAQVVRAQEHASSAIKSLRVSSERGHRSRLVEQGEVEKRLFDEINDVWLSHRGRSHD